MTEAPARKWRQELVRRMGVGIILMLVGGIAGMVAFARNDPAHNTPIQFFMAMCSSMGITVAGFVYMCLTIRCPECRLRLFLSSARDSAAGATLGTVLTMQACPRCGVRLNADPPQDRVR
jgi:hypothetical protein